MSLPIGTALPGPSYLQDWELREMVWAHTQKWGLFLVLRGNWWYLAHIIRVGRLDWGCLLKQNLEREREGWGWEDKGTHSCRVAWGPCKYFTVIYTFPFYKIILVFNSLSSFPPCGSCRNNPERYLWTCLGEDRLEGQVTGAYERKMKRRVQQCCGRRETFIY